MRQLSPVASFEPSMFASISLNNIRYSEVLLDQYQCGSIFAAAAYENTGHFRRFDDVRDMSAYHPIAATRQTFRFVWVVPNYDVRDDARRSRSEFKSGWRRPQ
jgi:hypothetical protein